MYLFKIKNNDERKSRCGLPSPNLIGKKVCLIFTVIITIIFIRRQGSPSSCCEDFMSFIDESLNRTSTIDNQNEERILAHSVSLSGMNVSNCHSSQSQSVRQTDRQTEREARRTYTRDAEASLDTWTSKLLRQGIRQTDKQTKLTSPMLGGPDLTHEVIGHCQASPISLTHSLSLSLSVFSRSLTLTDSLTPHSLTD